MKANDMLEYRDKTIKAFKDGTLNQMMVLIIMC